MILHLFFTYLVFKWTISRVEGNLLSSPFSNIETANAYYRDNVKIYGLIGGAGSLVRPKIVRSVHYCPATKKTVERRYTDLTSFDAFPSSAVYPTKVNTLLESYFERKLNYYIHDKRVDFFGIS